MNERDPNDVAAGPAAPVPPASSEEPTEQELTARIEAEKAWIADTLRMFSEKAQSEVAHFGNLMSDYALPACGAAAALGWFLAPRRRLPPAIIRVETPVGDEPAVTVEQKGGRLKWGLLGLLGGALLAGVASRFLGGAEEASDAGAALPAPGPSAGAAVPPVHIGYDAPGNLPAGEALRSPSPITGVVGGPLADETLMP